MGEIEGEATTWLDKMHAISRNLDSMSYYCRRRAISLDDVGMKKLAREMSLLADNMDRDSEKLLRLIGEKVSEQLKDANEMSWAVFKATLAGMDIGKGYNGEGE